MKSFYLFLAILLAANFSFGQTGNFTTVSIDYSATNGQGLQIGNSNNSAYSTLQVNGSAGFGVSNWANSTVLESVPVSTGGLVLSSYTGDINFQTNNRSNRMTVASGGNVGIGTTNPISTLNVAGTTGLTWGQNVSGLVTIGDYGTGGSLWVNTGSLSNAWPSGLGIDGTYSSSVSTLNIKAFGVNAAGWGSNLAFSTTQNGAMVEAMRVDNSGNVGIGTTDPQGHKLAVNGDIIATEVTVKLHSAWPDYVFKPQYHLPALSELKYYIDQNQHLPDMPSESEVAKNGVNLGEMVKLQTKKIEELTLYLLQLKEENEALKKNQEQIKETLKHNHIN